MTLLYSQEPLQMKEEVEEGEPERWQHEKDLTTIADFEGGKESGQLRKVGSL